MDITTNRSDVYRTLLAFLKVVCLDQCGTLGASLLVGLCPFRRALQLVRRKVADAAADNNNVAAGGGGKKKGSSARGAAAGGHAKRKAAVAEIVDSDTDDENGNSNDNDAERTPVFQVLEQLDKQCKMFIKQSKKATGSDDLSSVDPHGLARSIREVHTQVTNAIAKMPRAFANVSAEPAQAVIDITGDVAVDPYANGKGKGKAGGGGGGGGGGAAASKEDAVYVNEKASYTGEIKSLQFRMAKLEQQHHAHYSMILATSASMGVPNRMRRITRSVT